MTEENNVPNVPDVKVSGLNLEEFAGKRAKIEKVSVIDAETSYDESGNFVEGLKRKVKVLKAETEALTTFEKDGETKTVRASELFNMVQDKETKEWGLSTSDNSKYRKFIKNMKCNELKDLIGKEVTVKSVERKGSTYLGFYTE